MAASVEHLPSYFNERILAEWDDSDTGLPSTLGSCSRYNKQAVALNARLDFDKMCLEISLPVTIHVGNRARKFPFSLIISPQHFDKLNAISHQSVSVGSPLVSQAARDAIVGNSDQLVRVHLRLSTRPIVAMPVIRSSIVKPTTAPAYDLLLGLRSLSRASCFTMYIRKNDFALKGLQLISNRLSDATKDGSGSSTTLLKGLFPGADGLDDGIEVD